MSTTIDTILKVKAQVEGQDAVKSLRDDLGKTSGAAKDLKNEFTAVEKITKGFLVGTAIAGGLGLIAKSAVNLAKELTTVSEQTGVSATMLAHMKGAADLADVSLSTVGDSISNLNKSIINSQDGTSRQAAAFKALGVETVDATGKLRKTEDIISDMANQFSKFENGAGKNAVAMDLMGSSGKDMIPILNQGAEAIRELGLEVGPDFTRNAKEFQDNIAAIRTQFSQVALDIGADLLPGMASLAGTFADNNVAVKLLTGTIKVLETSFVGWLAVGTFVTNEIGRRFAQLHNDASTLVSVMKELVTFDFKGAREALKQGGEMEKIIDEGARDDLADKMAAYQKNINDIWSGKNKGAGAGGAESPSGAPLNYDPKGGSNNARKAKADYDRAADAADNWILKQREAIETLRLEGALIGKTSIEVKKLKDARNLQSEAAEKARNMTSEQAEAFKLQVQEINNARQAIIQYNDEQSRTFGAGAAEFFAEYSEKASDTASQIKDALSNAFSGAEDALVDFVTTGKASFKDLARSIIADLARIAIRKSITGPLSNILGSFIGGFTGAPVTASANGNIMTDKGPLALNTYASGGIASSPQISIFGEGRQPEAYVPLPDGRTIPVTMNGGNSAGVNVVVNVDAKGAEKVQGNNQTANQLGRGFAAAIKNVILEEQRPGGLLARA